MDVEISADGSWQTHESAPTTHRVFDYEIEIDFESDIALEDCSDDQIIDFVRDHVFNCMQKFVVEADVCQGVLPPRGGKSSSHAKSRSEYRRVNPADGESFKSRHHIKGTMTVDTNCLTRQEQALLLARGTLAEDVAHLVATDVINMVTGTDHQISIRKRILR